MRPARLHARTHACTHACTHARTRARMHVHSSEDAAGACALANAGARCPAAADGGAYACGATWHTCENTQPPMRTARSFCARNCHTPAHAPKRMSARRTGTARRAAQSASGPFPGGARTIVVEIAHRHRGLGQPDDGHRPAREAKLEIHLPASVARGRQRELPAHGPARRRRARRSVRRRGLAPPRRPAPQRDAHLAIAFWPTVASVRKR